MLYFQLYSIEQGYIVITGSVSKNVSLKHILKTFFHVLQYDASYRVQKCFYDNFKLLI